jgi:exonuclease SbcC
MSSLKLKVQKYRRFTEPQEIAFQSGLTIVSGSNGAGKSTLVEAMLFALFGTTRGASISEIRSDKTRGEPHVECELLIDDQVVTIMRHGNTAEIAVNGVVQVMGGRSNAKSANACLTALLGGLTRDQFESSYIALQGDIAGLVESKAKVRRDLIEQILQLEVLADAVDLQVEHCDIAKKEIIALGNVICDSELLLHKEARAYIESFQSARTIHSRASHTKSFQVCMEQAITDQQKRWQDVERSVIAAQADVSALERQQSGHLSTLEKATKTYQQQEERQQDYNKLQENIAGIDGQLAQVEQDIQKFRDALEDAEQCVGASSEYARLLEEEGGLKKRRMALPLIKKCYDDFIEVERKLADLDLKLADMAGVDEELRQVKGEENQCSQRRDELSRNDPTATAYEVWHRQNSKLELEMQQNRQALKQLTNRADEARCPTCNQHYTEHTPEQRVQHLTTWLDETFPPLYQELQQQKQLIDEQKERWEQTKVQAEDEYSRIQKDIGTIEKRVLTRDQLKQQRDELDAGFLAKQQAWMELKEDVPDLREDEKLVSRLVEVDKRLRELKDKADRYALIPFYQRSCEEKAKEQESLEARQQSLLGQQRELGYSPESYQTAKDLVERLREEEREIRDRLHQAGLKLQSTKGELQWVQEALRTLQGSHDRFCTYVQEYYKQEHLREHLEAFKVHFFEANTGEVMRRTTRLLIHAVTDQSILGVRFDKDELQYLDASNIAYPVSRLSGGEKALVGLCLRIALAEQAQAIARAGRMKFLVLDEVLSSLDDERCDAVQRILADVQRRGIFEHIIMITHLDSVKQGWRASGLVVQKVDGKTSRIIAVPSGEVSLDVAEEIEV